MFPFPHRRIALRALGDGCIDVIPKPIDRLLLEDMLRQVLERRHVPKPEPPEDARRVS